VVPIVTGFIGATPAGQLTTLGRGGSDYSATILGAALDAEEVIIWTDVDGVLTADPRLVPQARTIPVISYREAAELAYFGGESPASENIEARGASGDPRVDPQQLRPERLGTKITPEGQSTGGGVKALTAIRDVTLISLGGPGIVGLPDVVGRTFSTTADVRANVLLISPIVFTKTIFASSSPPRTRNAPWKRCARSSPRTWLIKRWNTSTWIPPSPSLPLSAKTCAASRHRGENL